MEIWPCREQKQNSANNVSVLPLRSPGTVFRTTCVRPLSPKDGCGIDWKSTSSSSPTTSENQSQRIVDKWNRLLSSTVEASSVNVLKKRLDDWSKDVDYQILFHNNHKLQVNLALKSVSSWAELNAHCRLGATLRAGTSRLAPNSGRHPLTDWLTELWFYVPWDNNKAISETFPKPISWLGMEKLNLTQQKHTFTNQKKYTTTQNTHKN